MAKDPICGMEVKEKDAKWKSEYKGKTYFFCAPGCKTVFDKEPEKYVKKKQWNLSLQENLTKVGSL